MSELPKLDGRNSEDILNEIKFLAKQYTPEWNFDSGSSDFGVVLAKTFAKMTEGTINRYNKTVYNYYLTFLNMLGTKLRPASPASGMVVVEASGSDKGVYIDKGMGLFASADTEDGMTIYETTDPLTAIDTSIKSIYTTDGQSDFIGLLYKCEEENKNEIKPFRIFDSILSENLQSHEIYFEDSIIFDMSDTDILFRFYNSLSAKGEKGLIDAFSDKENVFWEYKKGENWEKADFSVYDENFVRVKFQGKSEISTLMNKKSRYIRCRFKKVPEDSIMVTSVKYYAISDKISPDSLLCDETQLSEKDFFPFGERYDMYSKFTVKCDEAFTKKGATITVSADVQFIKVETNTQMPGTNYKSIMNESDFASMKPQDIKIDEISWEYWNGIGWSRLETDENATKFFTATNESESRRTFKFVCPDDIESIAIGAVTGTFIRAGISKMNNRFDFYANYITPYIHRVEIHYDYGNKDHSFENVVVKSDLSLKKINLSDKGVNNLLKNNLCLNPAMYICLSKPLTHGIIRLFVDIKDGMHRFNPPIKWEYLAKSQKGIPSWKHVDVMDATDDLSHSETVTMIGKDDFEEETIFGEKGYFIRIVNPNGKYSKEAITSRPIINDIKFNAVRIIQKNTLSPEYFSIEKNEENKLCKLSRSNVASVEVWVDEMNELTAKEQEEFLKKGNKEAVAEYDELGKLEKLWIKWKAVPNVLSFSMNDRVYEVDYPKGEILFGDGRKGKIPPAKYNESIKIKYSVCNGSTGNVEENRIQDFVTSISHVDKVYNPSPVMGGVDMETIDSAAGRMFSQISGGNRLVSLKDFEDSICFNDRNIYKVKCLSHVDEYGNRSLGTTSIAVLPRVYMQGYEKFQGIKKRIWEFMDEKAPATLARSTRLKIFEVEYVETSVSIDVVIEDFNFYQGVYSGIESRLKKFLNPVTGNFSGKGWLIGKFPRKEFIYNYIKTVPNIKWIKNVNIFTNLITSEGSKEIDFELVKTKKFVVPICGTPEINIVVE